MPAKRAAGAPITRSWNVVQLKSEVLSPAVEAFRYFITEHDETQLMALDAALIAVMSSEPAKGTAPFATGNA